jgi:hypothetical protein
MLNRGGKAEPLALTAILGEPAQFCFKILAGVLSQAPLLQLGSFLPFLDSAVLLPQTGVKLCPFFLLR